MFLLSCSVLFGVAASINRNPSVGLLVFLGLIAVALAFAGRELLRSRLARSRATMADMVGSDLGFKVKPIGDKVIFSFANGRIADEFARLNGQTSATELKGE
jgi:small-conductance mechanosensitive channel